MKPARSIKTTSVETYINTMNEIANENVEVNKNDNDNISDKKITDKE